MRTSSLAATAPLVGACLLVGALGAVVTVAVFAEEACTDGIAEVEQAMETRRLIPGDADTIRVLVSQARTDRDSGKMLFCRDAVASARLILKSG